MTVGEVFIYVPTSKLRVTTLLVALDCNTNIPRFLAIPTAVDESLSATSMYVQYCVVITSTVLACVSVRVQDL